MAHTNKTESTRSDRYLWAMVLTLALVFILAVKVGQDRMDQGCTTDTDCMEKFGGNGDPEPIDQ